MRRGLKFLFKYAPEGEGGAAPADVTQAEQHVETATQEVKAAATDIPSGAIHDVLKSLQETLSGVQAELKRSNDRVSEAVKPAEAAEQAAAPDVAIEVPKVERRVRRGTRKVKR